MIPEQYYDLSNSSIRLLSALVTLAMFRTQLYSHDLAL